MQTTSESVQEKANALRPNLDMQQLSEDTLVERAMHAASTVRWWQAAHISDSPYHQQFPGYCMFCS